MRWRRSARFTAAPPPRRMAEPGTRSAIPIICIGNFVVGGAGKTPTAIEVASVCRGLGISARLPVRAATWRREARADPRFDRGAHGARGRRRAAARLPFTHPLSFSAESGRKRGEAACQPRRRYHCHGRHGFQNPSLVKDGRSCCSMGTRDGGAVFRPARCAPLAGQIRRTDAVVVIGEGPGGEGCAPPPAPGCDLGAAEPLRGAGEVTTRARLRGIADPQKFDAGSPPRRRDRLHDGFPDHHWFSGVECGTDLAQAKRRDSCRSPRRRTAWAARPRRRGRSALPGAEMFPVRALSPRPRAWGADRRRRRRLFGRLSRRSYRTAQRQFPLSNASASA